MMVGILAGLDFPTLKEYSNLINSLARSYKLFKTIFAKPNM